MADYNVNMKQWNGTSFDNVLPLAYNAKRLEGQTVSQIKADIIKGAYVEIYNESAVSAVSGDKTEVVFDVSNVDFSGVDDLEIETQSLYFSRYSGDIYSGNFYQLGLYFGSDTRATTLYADASYGVSNPPVTKSYLFRAKFRDSAVLFIPTTGKGTDIDYNLTKNMSNIKKISIFVRSSGSGSNKKVQANLILRARQK